MAFNLKFRPRKRTSERAKQKCRRETQIEVRAFAADQIIDLYSAKMADEPTNIYEDLSAVYGPGKTVQER